MTDRHHCSKPDTA